MYRFIVLAVFLALTTEVPGLADTAPPPRTGNKMSTHTFRFLGTEDFPDHVFFFAFNSLNNGPLDGPPHLTELKGNEPLSVSGDRIEREHLFAIPRKQTQKMNIRLTSEWERIPGVLRWPVHGSSSTTVEYRVISKNGKMRLELLTAPGVSASEAAKGASKEWFGTYPLPWIVGGFLALSISTLGIWLARRNGRKTADI